MRTYKIKDVAQIVDGAKPSTQNKLFWNGDITWVTVEDLKELSSKYIYTSNKKITKEGLDSCSTKIIPIGTILVGSYTPIRYVAIAGDELCTNNNVKSLICNADIVDNEYMYYWILAKKKLLELISSESADKKLINKLFKNVKINLPDLKTQQHIVNIISSADDIIQNLTKQIRILNDLGVKKINLFNQENILDKLTNIAEFEGGAEVGSSNYTNTKFKNSIPFIRVGNLLENNNDNNIYINANLSTKIATFNDILMALVASPGRNNIGLSGAYASAIWKLNCDIKNKGLVYFEINSLINKKIIADYYQGTTIPYADKSIENLIYAKISNENKELLNFYFELILQHKKKVSILKDLKAKLLEKYF